MHVIEISTVHAPSRSTSIDLTLIIKKSFRTPCWEVSTNPEAPSKTIQ